MEYEDVSFQQQALEIPLINSDFNPKIAPTTGEEFLMHMLYERSQCDKIKVASLPKQIQNTLDLPVTSDNMTIKYLCPTLEWKNTQTKDFLSTRNRISIMRSDLEHEFNYSQNLEPPLTAEATDWLEFCRKNPPLLRIILRLNQRTLEQLLEFIAEWLDVPENTNCETNVPCLDLLSNDHQWLGSWLYAVVCCLHLPLEPQVHSTLRDIARLCIRWRSNLKAEDIAKAAPFNLFIHLIAQNFGQLDFKEYV